MLVEEAMLLLATALEGRLQPDRPRLEQALLEHPSLRAAAADMALAPAEQSDAQESPAHRSDACGSGSPRSHLLAIMDCTAVAGCFGGHHGQRLLGWSMGAPTNNNGIDIPSPLWLQPVEAIEALSNDVLWEEFGS